MDMYVYARVRGDGRVREDSFEVVAISDSDKKLRQMMKGDIQEYLNETYDDQDDYRLELVPVDQVDDFWCDDCGLAGAYMEFHIFEVPVV